MPGLHLGRRVGRSGGASWTQQLKDGISFGYYNFRDVSTITKDGSNRVSKVVCSLGIGPDLVNAGADNTKPVWDAEGITEDGVRQFIKSATTALAQPLEIYFVVKMLSWTSDDYMFDGDLTASVTVHQKSSTPKIQGFAGGTPILGLVDTLPLNTWGIIRAVFDNASGYGKLQTNTSIPFVSTVGTNAMNGITIGRTGGDLGAYFANQKVAAMIVRKAWDLLPKEKIIYNGLNTDFGIGFPDVNVTTGQFDNGKLVICFDDALKSVYTTAYPIFTAQGEKFTTSVIGNLIGGASNCSAAELQEMAAAGHDIQCHTHTHINLAASTAGAITANLDANNAAFIANGLTAPIHISYPYGYYSKAVIDAMAGRRVSGRITTARMADFVPIYKDTDKFQLSSIFIDNLDAAGLTALNVWLDDAMAKKYAIIVFAHGVTVAGTGLAISSAMLNSVIDSAQSKGLDIITRSELYTAMTS